MNTEVMLREVNLTTNTKMFERTSMNYEEIESMVEYFDSTKDAHEDTKDLLNIILNALSILIMKEIEYLCI